MVSIVSGRGVEDLRGRVGIDGLVYAGHHGLEIAGGGLRFDEMTAAGRKEEIEDAIGALSPRMDRIAGVLVESKRLSASIHYRRARPSDR